ncbi:MAG: hypothetical protein Q4D50_13135, partial [Eubacteriales bacterium]|nr:hypothetical protein [Eubacteriales bacterium]
MKKEAAIPIIFPTEKDQAASLADAAPECRKSKLERRSLPISIAPKPPLCKGRWGGASRLGGIVQLNVTN